MVEVPNHLMARHIIAVAREWGEYGEVYDTAHEGPHGEAEYETEWSIADLQPEECTVECKDGEVRVYGHVTATYQAQTLSATYNPPGSAHPAEYENRSITLAVTIVMDMTKLPAPLIHAKIA